MACSSFSNVASSSFFHYNAQFSTRKKGHQVRQSYHGLKSSKYYGKVMKNSRKLGKILHYVLNLNLVFSTLPDLDSCQKIKTEFLSLHHLKVFLFNANLLLKIT